MIAAADHTLAVAIIVMIGLIVIVAIIAITVLLYEESDLLKLGALNKRLDVIEARITELQQQWAEWKAGK